MIKFHSYDIITSNILSLHPQININLIFINRSLIIPYQIFRINLDD